LYGAERAQETLGVEKAVSNERFEEVMEGLLQDSPRRFFYLPLPDGVPAGSELERQLTFFREHVPLLEVEGDFRIRSATGYMLSTDSPERFAQIQPVLTQRLTPDAFADSTFRDAFTAFTTAASFEDWQSWKAEHLAHYADGMTLSETLGRLRMAKTDEEMALLQRAIDITTAAHREAARSLEPGMHEYEIEALVEYVFKRNGAEYPGFPSIVGSGENATILHYTTSRREMEADDLVVIDIGAEYHGYSADVTRTLPVNGTFSPEQKAIYELVLEAQEAGIEAACADSGFGVPGQAATRIIADGLMELGLIENEADVRRFFMHGTSHYLGLYVHDVGDYGPLVPGTVITVEPGVYIAPSEDVDPKWWNIGVRIEDDILITDGDPVNLSRDAPRTVEAIETLMQERGLGNEEAGLVDFAAPETGDGTH
ncbi:MAG: M24B family metallopeptidase, partial [Rhodothermales bacterium]